jgi:hypothetical protein
MTDEMMSLLFPRSPWEAMMRLEAKPSVDDRFADVGKTVDGQAEAWNGLRLCRKCNCTTYSHVATYVESVLVPLCQLYAG